MLAAIKNHEIIYYIITVLLHEIKYYCTILIAILFYSTNKGTVLMLWRQNLSTNSKNNYANSLLPLEKCPTITTFHAFDMKN